MELACVVTNQNPMDGHLFLFRGRNGDQLKLLYWDRDGYALAADNREDYKTVAIRMRVIRSMVLRILYGIRGLPRIFH